MSATPAPVPTPDVEKPGLLINRGFGLLWAGQTVSDLGDWIYNTTLVLWIATRLAHGQSWAPLAVGGLFVARALPAVLIGPLAGVFVDRWDRRRVMLRADLLRALLVLSLVPLTGLVPLPFIATGRISRLWQLGAVYAIVCLATAGAQFFGPARRALLGDIVPDPYRARAAGLQQVTLNLAFVVGPALASGLFFALGPGWALAANALSFLISFGAVRAIRVAPTAVPTAVTKEPGKPGGVLRDLGAGLRFFVGERTLMALLVASILFTFGGGAINALDIFFVTGNLHAPAGYYGLLGAAQGVGAIGGALLAAAFAERIGLTRTFKLSLLLTGLGCIAYARMTGFWPAAALLCALGVPEAAFNVALGPLLLHVTPRELVGRVSAVLMPAVNLSLLSSGLLAGYLDSTAPRGFHAVLLGMAWGPLDTIFAASGLLMVAGGLYAFARLRDAATWEV